MTTITSITDIDTPLFDKKTSGLVLAGVLALHGLLAVGLANMTIPDIKPPVVTPPLEITFVTPPPPEVVKPEAIKPKEMPPEEKNPDEIKPKATPNVTPKLTPEPKVEPVKPLPKVEPLPKSQPVIQKVIPPTPTVPIEEQQPPKKPDDKLVKTPEKEPDKIPEPPPETPPEKDPITPPPENRTPEPNQNLLKAQQLAEQSEWEENERNRQQADAETARQAQLAQQKAIDEQHERNRKQADADAERKRADDEAKRKAQAQADAETEAKAKQDLADKKALEEAAAKAKKDLANKKAQEDKLVIPPPANNPVNFSSGEGNAHLRGTPNFHCSEADTNGKTLTASFHYRVDKRGIPTGVMMVKGVGNANLDKQLLQQARTARFTPFTNAQGAAVGGEGTLSFACKPLS